jgi:hypothetical protein
MLLIISIFNDKCVSTRFYRVGIEGQNIKHCISVSKRLLFADSFFSFQKLRWYIFCQKKNHEAKIL